MRKLVSVLLLVVMLQTTAFAQSFSDVPANHVNMEAINYFVRTNVVNGYRDNTFRPTQTVTRAEATKLVLASTKPVAVIQGIKNDLLANYDGHFIDVDADDWFAPYVLLAQNQSIIKGYRDHTFRPHDTIKFAEGLKMIFKTYGLALSVVDRMPEALVSGEKTDWYTPYFYTAIEKNIINPQKYYHPSQRMSRGEFLEVLYRTKMLKENSLERFTSSGFNTASNEYTITIPQLNLVNVDVSFADPYNATSALEVLKYGLGHYLGPPGSGQKLVLFGHSSGYNWDSSDYKQILRGIDALEDGDQFYINYQNQGYAYRVNHSEIIPQSQLTKVMDQTPNEQLVMYTCWPPDRTSHRYLIYATPI